MNRNNLGFRARATGTPAQGIAIVGLGSTKGNSNKRARSDDEMAIAGVSHPVKRHRHGSSESSITIARNTYPGKNMRLTKWQQQQQQQQRQQRQDRERSKAANIEKHMIQQRIRQTHGGNETMEQQFMIGERLPTIAEVGATASKRRSFFGHQMEEAYKEALREVLGLEMKSLAREMGMEATVEIRRANASHGNQPGIVGVQTGRSADLPGSTAVMSLSVGSVVQNNNALNSRVSQPAIDALLCPGAGLSSASPSYALWPQQGAQIASQSWPAGPPPVPPMLPVPQALSVPSATQLPHPQHLPHTHQHCPQQQQNQERQYQQAPPPPQPPQPQLQPQPLQPPQPQPQPRLQSRQGSVNNRLGPMPRRQPTKLFAARQGWKGVQKEAIVQRPTLPEQTIAQWKSRRASVNDRLGPVPEHIDRALWPTRQNRAVTVPRPGQRDEPVSLARESRDGSMAQSVDRAVKNKVTLSAGIDETDSFEESVEVVLRGKVVRPISPVDEIAPAPAPAKTATHLRRSAPTAVRIPVTEPTTRFGPKPLSRRKEFSGSRRIAERRRGSSPQRIAGRSRSPVRALERARRSQSPNNSPVRSGADRFTRSRAVGEKASPAKALQAPPTIEDIRRCKKLLPSDLQPKETTPPPGPGPDVSEVEAGKPVAKSNESAVTPTEWVTETMENLADMDDDLEELWHMPTDLPLSKQVQSYQPRRTRPRTPPQHDYEPPGFDEQHPEECQQQAARRCRHRQLKPQWPQSCEYRSRERWRHGDGKVPRRGLRDSRSTDEDDDDDDQRVFAPLTPPEDRLSGFAEQVAIRRRQQRFSGQRRILSPRYEPAQEQQLWQPLARRDNSYRQNRLSSYQDDSSRSADTRSGDFRYNRRKPGQHRRVVEDDDEDEDEEEEMAAALVAAGKSTQMGTSRHEVGSDDYDSSSSSYLKTPRADRSESRLQRQNSPLTLQRRRNKRGMEVVVEIITDREASTADTAAKPLALPPSPIVSPDPVTPTSPDSMSYRSLFSRRTIAEREDVVDYSEYDNDEDYLSL